MTRYDTEDNEFPYFDAARRLELFMKSRRRLNRKSEATPTTPLAEEYRMTNDKEYILSQLFLGLAEALTGLKGHEQGRLIIETEKENIGNSWRHDLAYKTKQYRFEMIKKSTDSHLQWLLGNMQSLEFIFHDLGDQLDKELDSRRTKKNLLSK